MMRAVADASTRFRRAILALALVLIGVGIWQVPMAQVDVLPEFGPTTVQVQTEALGLSAPEVEQLITVPLEQDLLNGVAYLRHIHSESVPGLSSIDLVFEEGTDLLQARQVVQERLTQAHALPNVSAPPQMLQPLSATGRVAMIGLTSSSMTAIEMGVVARWTLRPRLMGVPGVANVAIWGQKERQLQVQVDPDRLRAAGVTLEQVIRSTGNALLVSPLSFLEASTPGTGGFIDTNNQRLGVQHVSPIRTAGELSRVSLEETGRPLTVGDVAEVVEDHQPLIGEATVGNRDGMILVVEKFPEANTVEVTKGIEQTLKTLAPGLKGLTMDSSVFRPASYVDTAVTNLRTSALAGALLAVLVLLGLLLDWRRAVVVTAVTGTAMLTSLLALHLAGTTVHGLVLAGLLLALGAVVHDAVTQVERAVASAPPRDPASGPPEDPRPPRELVVEASRETGRVAAYSLLVMLLALLPMYLAGGLAGQDFLPPVATATLVALVASFLATLVLTPALSVALLRRPRRESPVLRRLRGAHDRALRRVTHRPLRAVAITALGVATAVGVVVPAQLDRALLPALQESHLLITWEGPPGTTLAELRRVGTRAGEELRAIPGVAGVGAHFGRAITGDQVVGANGGMLWVSLDPDGDQRRAMETVREVVDGYPGLRHELLSYAGDRVDRVVGQTPADVTVRVYGTDTTVMRDKAAEVKALLERTNGVVGATVETGVDEPSIVVTVDLEKARQHRIKPGDVRRAATTLLSGIQVGSMFDDQKVFDVQVWGSPDLRSNLGAVGDLVIDTPEGGHVRLKDVASVAVSPTPDRIVHDGVNRRIDVTADVSGRGLAEVVADLRAQVGAMAFPLEHHAEVLTDSTARQDAERRLWLVGLIGALGVYLLLQAAFTSWRLATTAFLTFPLSLLGGFLTAWATGGGMTLATVAGALAVLALAVRMSVSLFQAAQRREAVGVPRQDAVADAAREGLAPVVTTVLTTAAAVLPLVVLGSRTGSELLHPMALVLLGGMVTTTAVSLLVLPTLYLRFAGPPPTDRTLRPGPEPGADQDDTQATEATAPAGRLP